MNCSEHLELRGFWRQAFIFSEHYSEKHKVRILNPNLRADYGT